LGNSLRAWSGAFREVGHHRAMVVVRAQPSVARRPEARAVPVDDHGGPSLGFSRDRGWTSDLVAGNIRAVDIIKGSVTTSIGPNNRWRSRREWVCTRVVNTVNGDFFDETVAQNATQMDGGGNESGFLEISEHDRCEQGC